MFSQSIRAAAWNPWFVLNFTLWFSGFRFAFFYPLSAIRCTLYAVHYPLRAAPPPPSHAFLSALRYTLYAVHYPLSVTSRATQQPLLFSYPLSAIRYLQLTTQPFNQLLLNFTLWFSGFRFAFFYPLSAPRCTLSSIRYEPRNRNRITVLPCVFGLVSSVFCLPYSAQRQHAQ